MRRRQHLQVSTFPFLAVLLCAMGALILVLLCMDRKSRQAAQARAQQKVNQVTLQRQADHERIAESRRKEHETKKRVTKQTHEKKREALQTRVDAEEQALAQELAQVRARLADAASKMRDKEASVEELRKQLQREKALLAKQEAAVQAARTEATGVAAQLSASDQARAKLTAEMTRLEKQLGEANTKREKEAKGYSLVPYSGTRGEDRRPIYIECTAQGCVFHPDKKLVSSEELRPELRTRLQVQTTRLASAGVSDKKPYILLLVRPDNAATVRFYEVQAAARELGIDFGYELVDADWALRIPEDHGTSEPPPWTVASPKKPEAPSSPSSSVLGMGTPVGLPAKLPDAGEIERSVTSASGRPTTDKSEGVPAAMLGPVIGPQAEGHPRPLNLGSSTGSPHTVTEKPVNDAVTLLPPSADARTGGTRPNMLTLPPLIPSTSETPTEGKQGVASATGGGKTGSGQVVVAPEPAGTQSRTLRPANVSGTGESVIFVECRYDMVLVLPSQKPISVESLNHSPAYNALLKAVAAQVQRRQALARPGEKHSVRVRFLVHGNGGERTLYLAYPVLESLKLPMDQYKLQAWDDVARIIAE